MRLACTVLCNLGIVSEAQNRLGDAISNYEKAVAAAHNLGDRRAEGQFRGHLALVYARTGRIGDARICLGLGEALLRAASDPLSLALLLCGRAETEHLAGDTDTARSTLATIDELISQLGLDPESQLCRKLSAVKGCFTEWAVGEFSPSPRLHRAIVVPHNCHNSRCCQPSDDLTR